MKRELLLTTSLVLLLSLGACSGASDNNELENSDFKGQTLTIYNCADYISSGVDGSVDLISKFEKEYGVKVNYYTYDTNETMYNQFTLQKQGTYDLICTSEYMIQKMVKENLIEPFVDEEDADFTSICPNYEEYASNALREKLRQMKVVSNGKEVSLDQYAVGYMWGTLGIIYDPEIVSEEDVKSWNVFWNEDYKNKISIKNSMRDTYVVGLMHYYSNNDEKFNRLREAYLSDDCTKEDEKAYNDYIQEIFDFDLSDSVGAKELNESKIGIVKDELISLKQNIFGFEVDSGKTDIITGKIAMNLAWSGDAVYSIDTAEEQAGKVLHYSVPEDGANIWYDGWTLPKGSNKELALKFLDFLNDPNNASDNVDYIGYTSFVAGEQLFDLATNWYGVSGYSSDVDYFVDRYDEDENIQDINCVYNGKLYRCIKDTNSAEGDEDTSPLNSTYWEEAEFSADKEYYDGDMVSYNGEYYSLYCEEDSLLGSETNPETDEEHWELSVGQDLSYFFGDLDGRGATIYPGNGCANELETQYPSEKTIARCAIMNDFGSYNDDVIIMWGQVKAYTNMIPVYVFLGIVLGLGISLVIFVFVRKKIDIRNKRKIEKK